MIPSVDGLSVMDGKPAGRKSGGYVVGPHQTLDISGWRIDDNTVAEFGFGLQNQSQNKTYVEELKAMGVDVSTKNQGVVGFMVLEEHFSPTLRFSHGYKPSYDDTQVWRKGGFEFDYADNTRGITSSCATHSRRITTDISGLGTIFGNYVQSEVVGVEFNRGAVIAEMVMNYNTYSGLKKLGIDMNQFKVNQPKGKHTISAFPADSGYCIIPE